MSKVSELSSSGNRISSIPNKETLPKFVVYTSRNLHKIPQLQSFDKEYLLNLQAIAAVLPFRVNTFVLEHLIDWTQVSSDPIFQLVFPQVGMLEDDDIQTIKSLLIANEDKNKLNLEVQKIRKKLNPHPSKQMELNIPDGIYDFSRGIQHKYRETVLFFPSQGQICHSYCSFCFRWPQFIGDKSLKFYESDRDVLLNYLLSNPQVSNVILTGGDPMVMTTEKLQFYLEKLINPEFDSLKSIRIGTKALTYWPFRFTKSSDSFELIKLLKQLTTHKHITFMAHINHANELRNEEVIKAIKIVQSAGVVIRSQAPIVKYINDSAEAWVDLWSTQESLGIVPYYMFIERKTGAYRYFQIPIGEAYDIYREAYSKCSGLVRTVRGPSMSTDQGKVEIIGIRLINQVKVFVLRYVQARNPDLVQKPFFAYYDASATWFDELRPLYTEDKIFFET